MKIAFFVVKNIGLGGGIEKYTQELGRRLVQRGHKVTVYSMKHYGDMPVEFEGMEIIGVPSIPMRATEKLSASATAAFLSVFRDKPDIAHFHSIAAGAFAWMSRIRSLPCVLQMHGLEWKRSRFGNVGSAALKFLETNSLRQVKACTAVSKVQCEYFAEKYGVNMEYIPTGADIKPFTPAQEICKLGLESKQYVLFASRLVREKGAHHLIPAFRRLNTDMKLFIAGDVPNEDGYKKELLELAGGDSRIIFPGFVRGRLLDELFSNAAVYTQPSEIEGLSIALLEAMSYGNPCLVSDIPENIEAIEDTGYRFVNKDINSLSEKLSWVLSHPVEAEGAGQLARKRVAMHFSWDHVTDQFEKLYSRILGNDQQTEILEIPANPTRKSKAVTK